VNTYPVRVSILGAGNVLSAYLQAMDRLIPRGVAVLAGVCARRQETWPALHAQRPGIELVSTPAELFASDADVIVVITPPSSHAELIEQAIASGKHVLAEKPLALGFAQARHLVTSAADRGVHLVCAPFVQLAPTFRALWTRIVRGDIGRIHSVRGLYGNAGSTWARWYHAGEVGPLAELGIYNLKSITALAGPVKEVFSAEATAVLKRVVADEIMPHPSPDVSHIILRHESGALSSIVSSHAIQRYKRPAIEIYGTYGTANLLGDDWDPQGFEIWRNDQDYWEEHEPIEPTWLWTDGLRELVVALREGRTPIHNLDHDLHLLEVVEAADRAAREKTSVPVYSRFPELSLHFETSGGSHHLHDHTRPSDEQ
jgi:predicted dehydrogenase